MVLTPAPGAQLPLVELDRPVSISRIDEQGNTHRVHGRNFVRERAAGRTWRVSDGGFWQIHPEAPDTLVDAVLDGLDPQWGENALDLYCGVGLFAGALADRVGEDGAVLGIESGKQAVADARHNLAALENVQIECDRVEALLPRTGITATDLIVLDPPRAGPGGRPSRTWPVSAPAGSRTWRATRRRWPGTSGTSARAATVRCRCGRSTCSR